MSKKKLEDVRTLPVLHRTVDADVEFVARSEGDKGSPQLYDLSVSSETEVTRWFGIEILDHSPGAIDMSRMDNGAAVLIDHYSDQVGVVESSRLDQKARKLRAKVRFSESARGQEVEKDVADKIRRNVSVGYRVVSMKQVELRDGVPVYKITRWTPLEVSIVSVPADIAVGVNRSGNSEDEEFPVNLEDGPAAVKEERSMLRAGIKMDGGGAGGTGEGGGSPNGTTATEKPKVEVQADNRKDYAEIVEMCDSNGMSARAAEFIRAGLTSDQVARKILAERTTKGDPQPGSESVEEMGAGKDAKEYSYARAILCAADNKFDGIEGEVHRELEKRLPVDVKRRGGILVPLRVNKRQTRTLDSKTIGKGVEVVPDVQGELIELLRNRAYVLQMGARLLTGLTQPISFPRQTGAIAIQWMAENGGVNVTASDPALGLATLIPKTLQATTAYSRQFLNTATIDSESWIRDEFAIVHGLAIDRAAIHGLGANGEPVGIYKQTGVGTVSFGGTVANFGKLVDMQTAVASVNALAGSLGYLMSPTAAGKMKQTLVASAAGSNMVWDGPFDNGTVAGYKAFATNQVSNVMSTNEATGGTELGVVFGNWMDFIVGLFAGMEIIVDPYALKKQGVIELTSFQMCDLLIRHPESFSKSNGAT